MKVIYIITKILTFPGALTKALFEQIMCRIFRCPVEDNRYLRTDEMCGHIEHELIKGPVKSYMFCFIPGLLNFLLACVIGIFPLVNILNLGNYSGFVSFPGPFLSAILQSLPAESQEAAQSALEVLAGVPTLTLDFIIPFFFAWVSISLLTNLFPIIEDAVVMKEQYKNLNVVLKIIFFPGFIVMQVGARLEKYGITFLLLVALTAVCAICPVYIPLISEIGVIPYKIVNFIKKLLNLDGQLPV